MFGATAFGSQPSAPGFGQTQPTGAGLFGQTSTTGLGQTTSPALGSTNTFGQPQQQPSTSLFGQPQQTSSLFGQSQQPQQTSSNSFFGQPQQQTPTSSLFGQVQQNQPTSSLFGQTQQPQQTSLFGQPQQTQQTSSLFGQPQQQISSLFGQPQQQTSSSFGQPQQTQQTSSLFGQPQQQQATSLFGQQPQTQQSTSLFGQPQTSSLFGQSQQPQTSSLFGQSPQPQKPLFGSTPATGGSFTSSWSAGALVPAQQPQQAIQPSLPVSAPLMEHLCSVSVDKSLYLTLSWEIEAQAIVNAYDPNHPQCRFQYALYNKVDDATGIEPAPAFRIHTGLYQQAIRENPDPQHLVPVPALGFDALKQRIAQQEKARGHHSTEIEICKERINQLEQDHDCIKKVSIPEYRQRHLDLSRRLLVIAKTLDIQQGRGFPRSDAELKLTKELEALERAADKLRVSVEGIASSVPAQDSQDSQIDMLRLNPSDPNFKRIYEFLDQQRESLKSLIALLNQDSRDLNVMMKGYSQKLQTDQPIP